jgi:hypothetical protein
MEIFQNISLGKSLKEPKEVTRVPGKVGSVLPRYSKINKDEIVGYVLDMKMPKARGKRKGRLVEYYGIKEYGSAEAAKLKAEGDYQKIILDPKYRELMTDKALVNRDTVVRSFLNHLENVGEFDGYEKTAPELKYLQSDHIDHRYEQINKYFKGWLNKEYEVEGIDRKNLTKEAKKELKNWNPKARGERTKVREQRMQFMDELNNRDISLAQVKKEFKKKFGKGKYYSDSTFRSTVNQFTQLKREGALPTNSDGSKTLSYGIEKGERSPWLKQALAENVQFSGNYSRLIRAADEARAKGNLARAKTLEDSATRFFGTKGILTRLPGNAEHPLSYTYGGKDNILKVDSLVRGDLNQTKKVLFDNPVRDLKDEYNLSKTTAKRKKQIRTAMESRKAFMNYLTSGTFDKGMAESVNFDFTPKKVYLSSTATPLDKLPKNYDFKKFVKKGKGYQESFEKFGGKLGLTTKSGFSKRIAMSDKNLAAQLRKAGFKCKYSAQSGGLARCDDPMNYVDDIKRNSRLLGQGSKTAKARAFSKFKVLADLGLFGEAAFIAGDVAVRQAMGRPFYEAFLAATFREGKADVLRRERAGGASKELQEAERLDKEIANLNSQIENIDALGDFYSQADKDVLIKRRDKLLKEYEPYRQYMTSGSMKNISDRVRTQNIIDSDRAKSLTSKLQLRDNQLGIPNIADYGEIDAGVSEVRPKERSVLPSSQQAMIDNTRRQLKSLKIDESQMSDKVIGDFINDQFTAQERMQAELEEGNREEQVLGFNPDKSLEIPSLLPKGTYIPRPGEEEELLEYMSRVQGAKDGGLMNLTRTTPPKRSLNKDSQGLASLPEYDR